MVVNEICNIYLIHYRKYCGELVLIIAWYIEKEKFN